MSLEDFFFTEHPALIKYECVSITHPDFSQDFNLVRNSAIGLKVEADPPENYIEYTYVPMEVKTLGSGHDMDQSMEFTIGDVGELLPAEIERISAANGFQTKPTIVYREYASNSTSMVATDQVTNWIFDGVDDYITMGSTPSMNFESSDSFSVSGWISTTTTAAGRVVWNVAGTSPPWRGWYVGMLASTPTGALNPIVPGSIYIDLSHESGSGPFDNQVMVASTTAINDGSLHHFLITYDGSGAAAGVTIYIDGVVDTPIIVYNTLSDVITGTGQTFNISSPSYGGPLAMTAKEISVFSSELNSSDDTDLYGGGTAPDVLTLSCASSLVGYWKLNTDDTDDADGVVDYSAGGNNGTAEGGLPTYTGGTNTVVHTGPVFGPFTLEINSIAFNKTGCTFTAKATAFNRARTGEVYDAARFPMLRAFV